jgi:hypothetical protein
MPFNQALFWFGLTAFATGLYYLWDAAVKRLHSIGLTVLGTLACAYTVYRDSHPELPTVHLWVILLVLTWVLLGYGIYIGRFRPVSVTQKEAPKLVIHRAVYGAGPLAELDITKRLSDSARDGLVIPVNNNFLVPTDPAPNIRKRLDVDYSFGSDTVFRVSRMEPPTGEIASLVLPEDTEIARLRKELSHCQAKYSTEKANDFNEKARAENRALQLEAKLADLSKPDDSLRCRLTTLIHETLKFLQDQGPPPKLPPGKLATPEGKIFMLEIEKRVHRVHSGFSLRLHPANEKIIFELGEKGIFDYELAELMQNTMHSEADISAMARRLMKLRDRLELIEYAGGDDETI